jgi:predicted MFS family arabinose efflux permease
LTGISTPRVPDRQPLWTREFAYILLTTFGLFVGYQALLVVVPLAIAAQGSSSTIWGTPRGVFLLAAVVSSLRTPLLLTRYRTRTLLVASLLLLGVPSFLHAAVDSPVSIVMLNIARGTGFGIGSVVTATVVSLGAPFTRRGEALGLFGLMSTSASVVGSVTPLALLRASSFDLVFVVIGSITLLGCVLAWQIEPVAATEGKRSRIVEVIGRPSVLLPFLTFTVTTAVYGGIVTFAPLYLSGSQLGSPLVFMFVLSTAFSVFRFYGGVFVDRVGPSSLLFVSLLCSMMGVLFLSWAPFPGASLLSGALFGSAFGVISTSSHFRLVTRVESKEYSVVNTLFNVAFTSGIGLGALIFGVIASFVGYSWMFTTAGLWINLAVLLFLVDRVLPTNVRR